MNKPVKNIVCIILSLALTAGSVCGFASAADSSVIEPEAEDKLAGYTEADRLSQRADEPTKEAYDLIVNSSNIKAIFCGHEHYDHISMVTPEMPQYVINCTTAGIVTVK